MPLQDATLYAMFMLVGSACFGLGMVVGGWIAYRACRQVFGETLDLMAKESKEWYHSSLRATRHVL